jgi:hypothetical protein
VYELANIDRDLYTIVAVDLRIDGPVTATVYAVDRGDGEISVVAFALPEPNVEDFIRRTFRRISVRLVAQLFRDHVLAVTENSSTEVTGT